MVDALASGASDLFGHGGSSPLIRTKLIFRAKRYKKTGLNQPGFYFVTIF